MNRIIKRKIQEFNNLTPSQIDQRIADWKSNIANGATIDEMVPKVFSLIDGCAFETLSAKEGTFFRARKNKVNKLFNNISELWCPNPEKCNISIGRVNRKGQSMMYIAQGGRTALFESKLSKGDYVTVAELSLKPECKINLQDVGIVDSLQLSSLKSIKKNRNKRLFDIGYSKQGVRNIRHLQSILLKEFNKNNDSNEMYILSVAISEAMLAYRESDGIVYGSLRSKNDYNIVLKPQIADDVLVINRCDGFLVENVKEGRIVIKHLVTTESIDNTGKLHWTDNVEKGLTWSKIQKRPFY